MKMRLFLEYLISAYNVMTHMPLMLYNIDTINTIISIHVSGGSTNAGAKLSKLTN